MTMRGVTPALNLLCQTLNLKPNMLLKEEVLILEAEFFNHICEELNKIFKEIYSNYFRITKLDTKLEETIMEKNFARCIVNDILSSEEYSIMGLASYTHTHEDFIFEIATGLNTDPAGSLLIKLIELHRMVRPELYKEIMKKIIDEKIKPHFLDSLIA